MLTPGTACCEQPGHRRTDAPWQETGQQHCQQSSRSPWQPLCAGTADQCKQSATHFVTEVKSNGAQHLPSCLSCSLHSGQWCSRGSTVFCCGGSNVPQCPTQMGWGLCNEVSRRVHCPQGSAGPVCHRMLGKGLNSVFFM